MTIIRWNRWCMRIADVYFSVPARIEGVDLVRCNQVATPVGIELCRPFYTLVLELRQTDAQVFAGFTKDTRNEVRRAERDGICCRLERRIGEEDLNAFCNLHDEVLTELPRINRKRLAAAANSGALDISWAYAADGTRLAAHAYFHNPSRVRLLHSISRRDAAPSIAGRANRLLHWADLKSYREMNVQLYDFGGWYPGHADPKRLRINQFKEEFGGSVRQEFTGLLPQTLRGRAAVAVLRSRRPAAEATVAGSRPALLASHTNEEP